MTWRSGLCRFLTRYSAAKGGNHVMMMPSLTLRLPIPSIPLEYIRMNHYQSKINPSINLSTKRNQSINQSNQSINQQNIPYIILLHITLQLRHYQPLIFFLQLTCLLSLCMLYAISSTLQQLSPLPTGHLIKVSLRIQKTKKTQNKTKRKKNGLFIV